MLTDKLFPFQSIIITLDVDTSLLERLTYIREAGFKVAEINTSDPHLLASLIDEFKDLKIGAGNIITLQELEYCYQAGVQFVSSPGFVTTFAQTAAIYSINYIPGIATPSEAMQVMALGLRQVRPYPADLKFCALLNKCFPDLQLFPAEVEYEEVEHYLTLPVVSAVSLLNPERKQLLSFASSLNV